ncbi:hypothetical protein [Nocardia sp. NPDC004260]
MIQYASDPLRHEMRTLPPTGTSSLPALPDTEAAARARKAMHDIYMAEGFGAGLAHAC